MEAKEALDRIAYVSDLVEEGRGNLSRAWWVLLVWGIAFTLIGFKIVALGPFFRSSYLSGNLLSLAALIGLPIIFAILLARPSSELTSRLMMLTLLLVVVFLVAWFSNLSSTFHMRIATLNEARLQLEWGVLPIIASGTILTATGIFISRSLARVGLLIALMGVMTKLLPYLFVRSLGVFSPWSGIWRDITNEWLLGGLYVLSGVILMVYAISLRSAPASR